MNLLYMPDTIQKKNSGKNLQLYSNDSYEPMSNDDAKKLSRSLLEIRVYYNLIKDDPETYKDKMIFLYLKLEYVNDSFNRNEIYNLPAIKKNRIIPILLELSTIEIKKIRICSLSILASLTYFLPDIINELIDNSFYNSIIANLNLPFFPEKRHVFRWIYNFLITHGKLSQQFFEKVPLSLVYQSAIDYLQYDNNSFCQVMFRQISLLPNLNIDQIQVCMSFFNFCLNKQNIKGIYNILYGIHKILTKTNKYPKELLCRYVVDLNIEKVISYYIQQDKVTRKKCFSFCLLGDLYELGFCVNPNLIPYLLSTINSIDLTDWFMQESITAIHKILLSCDLELVTQIFHTNICEKMLEISTSESYKCICLFLNRVDANDILSFVDLQYIELICSIVHSDDENLINLLISGFIRLVQITDMNNYLSILADYFLMCDGFSMFEQRFATDDTIPPEVLSNLYQTLERLSQKVPVLTDQ